MGLLDEIEAMAPRLRRVALALTGDTAAADDLVAHTIDRALARRHHDEDRLRRAECYDPRPRSGDFGSLFRGGPL